MRPDGTRNVVITDHLGSTRLTLSTDAAPMQSQLHNAFGEVTSDVGEGARTGYIGREHDVESDLGFYGVRLYEPEYGRFMSTDPLWGEYITLQPYQYAGNNPVSLFDNGGDRIKAVGEEAQQLIRESVESTIEPYVVFDKDGMLDVDKLRMAPFDTDLDANGAILLRMAENQLEVSVEISSDYPTKDGTKTFDQAEKQISKQVGQQAELLGVSIIPDHSPSRYNSLENQSTDNKAHVYINPKRMTDSNRGVTTAHELFGHVRFFMLVCSGRTNLSPYHHYVKSQGKIIDTNTELSRSTQKAERNATK